MPRTLDPTLEAALATGSGDFFARAFIWNGISYTQHEVLGFEIDNLTANVTVPHFTPNEVATWFYIQRGLKINGTEYPIDSSKFRTTLSNVKYPNYITIYGDIFWNIPVTTAGDESVETVLEDLIQQSVGSADFNNTVIYGNNSEWWHGIQFFPAGKVVLLNKANRLEQLLKQKYLAQICDTGGNQLKIIGSSQYFEQIADFEIDSETLITNHKQVKFTDNRKFIWRDEAETLHEVDEDGPLHNLGYIESTVTPILNRTNSGIFLVQSMPNLAITNGDAVSIDDEEFGVPILIKEVFSISDTKSPRWYYEIRAIQWTENSEGGAMPSTIERVSNYTPINTSTFNNNLDENVNNLQALAEAVDELTLGEVTQAELDTVEDKIDNHIADTSAAHAASAISYNGGTGMSATDVESAIDELATEKSDTGHSHSAPDASIVTYSPTTAADWDSSTDPGNVDDALDQLAERVTDLEAGGGGGDWEIIADVTLSSDTANFDFQSIPSTYKHLKLFYTLRTDRAAASDRVKVIVNNDTASNKYESILYYWFHTSTWGTIDNGATTYAACTFVCANTALSNSFGGGFIEFPDYANTTTLKIFQTRGGQMQSTTIKPEIYDGMAVWRDTSAINRITVAPIFGSNFKQYSRCTLYGMK